MIEIYRECYSISHGDITPEIFYTVCQEMNIFVKTLKIKMQNTIPTYSNILKKFIPPNHQDSKLFT